ncbi:MAG: ATP-dependent Clp protease adaptor ClpS [Pirellulales bacterium]|jgi:ATP-dependent Clp protease adaptor protein ClpS|nr:ATP-dependent Clp protease adaptor ClpS [Pirellulales bacterium]|tara:strand:+ start:1034 stop:1387 length:354 start_codon:yes stop_codon:yes gene_type:complete
MPSSASAMSDVDFAEVSQSRNTAKQSQARPQPRYHVVLWNDDDHTYEYVIGMLGVLFGHSQECGFAMAKKVDKEGRAIVLTTTKEHAELKRDQIQAFGSDIRLARSTGAMSASIEAE